VAQLAKHCWHHFKKRGMNTAETPRRNRSGFRVYFEMVVSEPDAFRILFIHSHVRRHGQKLRALDRSHLLHVSFSILDERGAPTVNGCGLAWASPAVKALPSGMEQQRVEGWPPAAAVRRATRRTKRELAWGGLRTVHRIVDSIVSDDEREGLRSPRARTVV